MGIDNISEEHIDDKLIYLLTVIDNAVRVKVTVTLRDGSEHTRTKVRNDYY